MNFKIRKFSQVASNYANLLKEERTLQRINKNLIQFLEEETFLTASKIK